MLRIEGVIDELYDVVCLPGVKRATSIGFVTDETRILGEDRVEVRT